MSDIDKTDDRLTDDERAYIVRVMRKIQRMNYDDPEPVSIIAKLREDEPCA